MIGLNLTPDVSNTVFYHFSYLIFFNSTSKSDDSPSRVTWQDTNLQEDKAPRHKFRSLKEIIRHRREDKSSLVKVLQGQKLKPFFMKMVLTRLV